MNDDISNTLTFYQRLGKVGPAAKFILLKDYEEKSSIKDFVEWNKPKEPDYIIKNLYRHSDENNFVNLSDVLTRFCYFMGAEKYKDKDNMKIECFKDVRQNQYKELSYRIGIQIKSWGGGPVIEIELLHRVVTEKDIIKDDVVVEQYIYTNYKERLSSLISHVKKLCEETQVKHNLNCIKVCPACSKYTFICESKAVCEFCDPEAYRAKKDADEKIVKTHGYIYFCTDEQYIKIGSSNKYPDKRILSLSTRYHKKFTLLGYIYTDNFVKKEHEIHNRLSSCRVAGEWFNIPISDLENMLSEHSYNYTMVNGANAVSTPK